MDAQHPTAEAQSSSVDRSDVVSKDSMQRDFFSGLVAGDRSSVAVVTEGPSLLIRTVVNIPDICGCQLSPLNGTSVSVQAVPGKGETLTGRCGECLVELASCHHYLHLDALEAGGNGG